MTPEELAFAGIARQAGLVRSGEVTPRELVELYLERIERLDPKLNAFRVVLAERALAEADEALRRDVTDGERPLHGVPIALKDNLDLAGELTTHGSRAPDEPVAEDAELTRRLREAGAIVIGKTNLSELAAYSFVETVAFGRTRNPWEIDRTTGGSSGGSGAAVAAGMVGCATGSDGAGSIRIPASYCGLYGLKPQRGRISMMPAPYHWHGMSAVGCLSRTVADTALFLDVASGPAAGDAHSAEPPQRPFAESAASPPERLRIAVSTKPMRAIAPPIVDETCLRAVEETAEVLASLGHEVTRHDPVYGSVGNGVTNLYLAGIAEAASELPHAERLEKRTKGLVRAGRLIPDALVKRNKRSIARHLERMDELFRHHDVLLTPTTGTLPVPVGFWDGRSWLHTLLGMSRRVPFTPQWNFLGNPAAAVPAGFTDDGLPLSVQLVARQSDEATLLSLSAQLEAERPWADRRPPVS